MPFSELVTVLRGDLTQLHKDLEQGKREVRTQMEEINRIATVGIRTSISGGRGSGRNVGEERRGTQQSDIDKLISAEYKNREKALKELAKTKREIEREDAAARKRVADSERGEAEQRKRVSNTEKAEAEQRQRSARQMRATAENQRLDLLPDIQRRELIRLQEQAEKDRRVLSGKQDQAEKEQRQRSAEQTAAEQENQHRTAAPQVKALAEEKEQRRLSAEQSAAAKENQSRNQARLHEEERFQQEYAARLRRGYQERIQAERDGLRQLANVQQNALRGRIETRGTSPELVTKANTHISQVAQAGAISGNFLEAGRQINAIVRGVERADTITGRLGKRFDDFGQRSLKTVVDQAGNLANILGAIVVGGVVGGFGLLVKSSLEVNTQFEVARISLGEILALTTELRDKQGQVVGSTRAYTANLIEAETLYGQIREAAKRTTLTTQELTEATQQSLGFALRGGATTKTAVPLIAQVANLAKSLGAQGQREIGAEVREVLTGNRLSQSRIGRTLGLSSEEIKAARAAGTLVELLNSKLAAGQKYLDDYKKSFSGITSTLQSQGLEALRVVGKQTFGQLVASLNILSAAFDKAFTPGKTQQFGEQLAEFTKQFFDEVNGFIRDGGLEKIKQGFIDLVQSVRDLVALIRQLHVPEMFLYLVQHARVILDVVLAFKGIQLAAAGRALLANQNAPGALFAGTRFGRGLASAASPFAATTATGAVAVTAISTTAAAAIGLAVGGVIGTAFNAFAREKLGVNQAEEAERRSTAGLQALRQSGLPAVELQRLRERTASLRAQLTAAAGAEGRQPGLASRLLTGAAFPVQFLLQGAASTGPTSGVGTRAGTLVERLRRQLAEAQLQERTQTPQLLSQERARQVILQGKAGDEELQRRVKAADEAESERKKRQSKELFFLRETAKLEKDDAVIKLREQAKAEEQLIRDKVLGKKRESALILAVERNLLRDIRDLHEKERIDTQKQVADLIGDRLGAIRAEAAEKRRVLAQSDKSPRDQARITGAINLDEFRKVRDLRRETEGAGFSFGAGVRNNEIAQTRIRNAKEFSDRFHQIEVDSTLSRNQKLVGFEKARAVQFIKQEREVGDVKRKLFFEAQDLARQIADSERQRFKERRDLELQARRLARDAAREARDFAKQQLEAQHALTRAVEDEANSRKRIGELAKYVGTAHLSTFVPEQPGIEGTKLKLRDEAARLFEEQGVSRQITEQARAANPLNRELGEALAVRQLRELRDKLSEGDVAGVQEELSQRGVIAGGGFARGARQIAAQAATTANQEADLGETEQRQALQRQREDQANPVRDARDRLKDLNDQIQDSIENYKNATADLRDNFTKAVNDAAVSVRDFGNTALQLLRSFSGNRLALPTGTQTAIQGAVGGLRPGVGALQASATPGQSFNFAPGAIVFNGVKSEDFRKVISDIIEQDRRVAGSGVR